MQLINFKISSDFIALEMDEKYLDLHGNFDFVGLERNEEKNQAVLKWTKTSGSWVPENDPGRIEIIFSDVTLFKSRERDSEMPLSEDKTLDSLGFVNNELIDEIEGFARSYPEDGANYLNISFASGYAIKIGAGKAECIIS